MVCEHGLPLTLKPIVIAMLENGGDVVIVPPPGLSLLETSAFMNGAGGEVFSRVCEQPYTWRLAFSGDVRDEQEAAVYRAGYVETDGGGMAVYDLPSPRCESCGREPNTVSCMACDRVVAVYVPAASGVPICGSALE